MRGGRQQRQAWCLIECMVVHSLLVSTNHLGCLPTNPSMCRQEQRVSRAADFWLSEVLVPSDTLVAAGVAYHLADLLLPELGKCVAEGGPRAAAPDDATLRRLLEPFGAALAATSNPAMVHRLKCARGAGLQCGALWASSCLPVAACAWTGGSNVGSCWPGLHPHGTPSPCLPRTAGRGCWSHWWPRCGSPARQRPCATWMCRRLQRTCLNSVGGPLVAWLGLLLLMYQHSCLCGHARGNMPVPSRHAGLRCGTCTCGHSLHRWFAWHPGCIAWPRRQLSARATPGRACS